MNDIDVSIYNCGVSGDNSEGLLRRFKVEAEARKPDVILFAIGINDSQYVRSKDNPRVSLEKFQSNLQELVNQAKNFGKQTIFIGLTKVDESKTMPVPWNTIKYYDEENIRLYNANIKEVCDNNKLLFVDMLDLLNNNDLYDGLHPNSQGHEKYFLRVRDFLFSHNIIHRT